MVGQRGVPATHGGIERHVEEVGARLAARGHEVIVYCRPSYGVSVATRHRGMTLEPLPSIATKHLDTATHSIRATMRSMQANADVVHFHGVGPGAFSPLVRAFSSARVVQTIHGLDQRRAKWNGAARGALDLAGSVSEISPHLLIGVSEEVTMHYLARGCSRVVHVPNGVTASRPLPPGRALERLGLAPGRYVLSVGRLVPEKSLHVLIRAFRRLVPDIDVDLVIVGGTSHSDAYVTELERLAAGDPRVRLVGYRYGDELAELYANAAAFCIPSSLEGLPLTLLEAVSYGLPVVASSIDPHVEVLAQSGPGRRLAPPDDIDGLSEQLALACSDLPRERGGAAEVKRRVQQRFRWDAVTLATEQLYQHVVAGGEVSDLVDVYSSTVAALGAEVAAA